MSVKILKSVCNFMVFAASKTLEIGLSAFLTKFIRIFPVSKSLILSLQFENEI